MHIECEKITHGWDEMDWESVDTMEMRNEVIRVRMARMIHPTSLAASSSDGAGVEELAMLAVEE